MTAFITDAKREPRSYSTDPQCWHVGYQFCGLPAEVIVYAENEVDARAQAADQLRRRGLKLAA